LGLQDILETIRSEADETASGLEAEARAESERLLTRAREEADDEERRLASSQDDRIRGERARALSQSHLEAARARRVAREQAYQKAVDSVRSRLGEIRGSDRYESLMTSLLDEAIAALPEADTVRVDPADVHVLRKVLAARHLEIDIETEETPLGGLVLAAPGRTVDNRLATRLERSDSQLRFVAGEVIPALRGDVE
jgi:vacuolar-type H+-ATPase subunit E/Vma4